MTLAWGCAATLGADAGRGARPFEWKVGPVAVGLILVVGAVWGFFHYRHQLTHAVYFVQSFGVYGVIFSILVMAVLAVIPVPSEFFVVVNMEVYGVFWGLLYSWIGAVIGAVCAMYLTRWLGQTWLRRWLPPERQRQVDAWVKRRGALGLLTLRFVPLVPFHALNYVAGLLNVGLWPFVWTTAVGIIPFEVMAGCVFLGISSGLVPGLIIGAAALAAIGGLSYAFRKKWLAALAPEPGEDDSRGDRGVDPREQHSP